MSNPMDEAEQVLEKAERDLSKFVWQKLDTGDEGIITFTGGLGATIVSVVAFAIPKTLPHVSLMERVYDGIIIAGPMVVRMPRDMAKRFFNAAAKKLNGRKTGR